MDAERLETALRMEQPDGGLLGGTGVRLAELAAHVRALEAERDALISQRNHEWAARKRASVRLRELEAELVRPTEWTTQNPTEPGVYWANLGWKEEMVEAVLVVQMADRLQFTGFESDGTYRDLDEARAWCLVPLKSPPWRRFEKRAGQ